MSPTAQPSTVRALLLAAGLVSALLYSNFLLDWVLRDFHGMGEVVSELAAPGEPNAVLLRTGDVLSAVLVVALLPWVRTRLRPGPWREIAVGAVVVFAAGGVVAALVPTPCGAGAACGPGAQQAAQLVHDASSIVSDVALYASVAAGWLSMRPTGPRWFVRTAWWVFWVGGIASSLAFEYFRLTPDPAWAVGAAQRVHIVCVSVWIAALTLLAASAPSAGPAHGAAPRESSERPPATVDATSQQPRER